MSSTPRVGVCIVRAELQDSGLLITVTANTSVTPALRSADPLAARKFVDIDDATAAVTDFLRRFGVAPTDEPR